MDATVLYGLYIAIVGIQILYFIGFSYFFPTVNKWSSTPTTPVSVLIAAKNELPQLARNLPKILHQEYPNFEVIVINDASTDGSTLYLQDLQKSYPNLHIVELAASKTYQGNKKNALRQGISIAQHEHLVFTDADCYPSSTEWLRMMASPLNASAQIVLGYGAYQKAPGFLNKLIRYETVLTALQYFSYAEMGTAYMGVGRNLAYQKTYVGEHPFASHQHIPSGDDDLVVNEKANSQNTASMIHPSSFTYSIPEKNLRSWIKQKRRHYTTASSYKMVHQLSLGLFFSTQFLFWFLAIILIALAFNWHIVISLAILRLGIQYLSFKKASKKLKEVDLNRFLPILDFSLVIVQLYCGILNLISKPKNW